MFYRRYSCTDYSEFECRHPEKDAVWVSELVICEYYFLCLPDVFYPIGNYLSNDICSPVALRMRIFKHGTFSITDKRKCHYHDWITITIFPQCCQHLRISFFFFFNFVHQSWYPWVWYNSYFSFEAVRLTPLHSTEIVILCNWDGLVTYRENQTATLRDKHWRGTHGSRERWATKQPEVVWPLDKHHATGAKLAKTGEGSPLFRTRYVGRRCAWSTLQEGPSQLPDKPDILPRTTRVKHQSCSAIFLSVELCSVLSGTPLLCKTLHQSTRPG